MFYKIPVRLFILAVYTFIPHLLYRYTLTFGLQHININLGYEREVNLLADKKKLGRPTNNPKGVSIHVRLDKECDTILKLYCKQEQIPKTEAIRQGIKKLSDDLKK